MATITLTIGQMTASRQISAADTTRLITALTKHYGQIRDPGNGQTRNLNNQEVFDAVFNGMVQSFKDIAVRQEATTTIPPPIAIT